MPSRSVLAVGSLFLTTVAALSVSARDVGRGVNADPRSSPRSSRHSDKVSPRVKSEREKTYLSYDEASPILRALREVLPAELRSDSGAVSSAWPEWVVRRDAEIRARLTLGDEDSLVNFLLFGTSYTRQPRITPKELVRLEQSGIRTAANSSEAASAANGILQVRLDDLVRGLVLPGNNERLQFLRRLVERRGYGTGSAADRIRLREYILGNLARVIKENNAFAKALEAARLLGDPSEEFAERSKLFRARGLSLDTSWTPNFAVEESLKAMQARGLLAIGSVRRVAIIGPGLDFTDKARGYDFYPQQTLQPFALIDSLLRLGLGRGDSLEVTTLDLSERVNHHLDRAVDSARHGQAYVTELPRDAETQWKSEALRYWERFGDHIGVPESPIAPPTALGALRVRAARVRPCIVSRIAPVDLNIVLQRLDLPEGQRFDLIVATNVFVYYDVFEQSLAVANVERMLRSGGLLLSNNALLELPTSRLRSVGYLTTIYSDRPDDGDHVVWYQRAPD